LQEAVRLLQAINGLKPDGVVGNDTWNLLANAGTRTAGMLQTAGTNYPPNAAHTVSLFEDAIRLYNERNPNRRSLPLSMARDANWHWLLGKENGDGVVGLPNCSIGRNLSREQIAIVHARIRHGERWTRSTATGLGQLIIGNVDRHYPDGRAGIGNPRSEAYGMLSYMVENYGSWAQVRQQYGRRRDRRGRRMEGW
jgi:hypothetical protein